MLKVSVSVQLTGLHHRGPAEVDSTPIYVALHNINLGDPIDAGMVTLQEFPTSMVPQGAVESLDEIEGRTPPPRLPMTPGHQVVGTAVGEGFGCVLGLLGQRVGVAWIYGACGACRWCLVRRCSPN